MKIRPLKFQSETIQWFLVLSRMLYLNLRSIGLGLMVRLISNSLYLLSSSLFFFLPSFLFFSLLPLFFSSYPFFVGSLPLRYWLIFYKNSLFLTLSSYIFSFLFPFSSFGSYSSKPSSTSLKTWESGEVGVWGDPMSPTMFFFFFFLI